MTIDERADAAALKFITDHTNIVIDSPKYRALVLAFQTIARDQRHACAEAVLAIDRNAWSKDAVHQAVMNA